MKELKKVEPLIFELSKEGKTSAHFPERHWEKDCLNEIPASLKRL